MYNGMTIIQTTMIMAVVSVPVLFVMERLFPEPLAVYISFMAVVAVCLVFITHAIELYRATRTDPPPVPVEDRGQNPITAEFPAENHSSVWRYYKSGFSTKDKR
jgi:hypothetical protein